MVADDAQRATRYTIALEWDASSRRWTVTSDDIVGLVLEASSLPQGLIEAAAIAPELMRLNGQDLPEGEPANAE